ncbi:MAG: tripartite tricarboxylate transporter substrate binding protein [Rhodocyclaceae bacterium]|nr:MAG: tripartite tricarboxylate transporter substrate binding protein [Rhodocyclaceae bacterium]
MNPYRRSVLRALAVSPLACHVALTQAQSFPGRAVRMVVPYAPGGGPDVLTRMLQHRLSAALQQTVFIENKVGAGGIIAAEYTAQQPADGHTMLLASSTHLTQKVLQPKVAFDPVQGFSHVTQVSTAPSLLVVSAASPYRTLDDLIRAAHAAPGKLFYGSGGIGSAAHLAGAALAHFTRMQLTHVPYRGSVDLAVALKSGDIQFAIPTASTILPLVGAGDGKLRALAITSASREESLPQLPTLKELTGSDDLVLVAWSGIWLPAGAPQAVIKKVFDAYHKVMTDTEVIQAHAKLGVTVTLSATPAAFSSFVAAELAKFQRIVDATGLRLK